MYVVLRLKRWENLELTGPVECHVLPDENMSVGFLPVYRTREAAQAVWGDDVQVAEIQEVQTFATGKRLEPMVYDWRDGSDD